MEESTSALSGSRAEHMQQAINKKKENGEGEQVKQGRKLRLDQKRAGVVREKSGRGGGKSHRSSNKLDGMWRSRPKERQQTKKRAQQIEMFKEVAEKKQGG